MVVWGVRRLRQYLHDIPFVICTDHRPRENLSKVAEHNARVQSWFEILPSYNFTMKCLTGLQNANHDYLSQLLTQAEPIHESALGRITDPTQALYISSAGKVIAVSTQAPH